MMIELKRNLWSLALFLLLSGLLTGCAGSAPRQRVLWPPPPNDPKLEWIDVIVSEKSIRTGGLEKGISKLAGDLPQTYLQKPMGIASAGDGIVYVADMDARTVRIYDLNTGKLGTLTEKSPFRLPIGLAMDSKKNLYVADGGSSTVLVFAHDNSPAFSFGGQDVIRKPAFIAIDEKREKIFVTDSGEHRVVVFDLAGKHLFSFGRKGSQEGHFFAPQGIGIDSQGRVYVADMLNARIQVFDGTGKFLSVIGHRGSEMASFEAPRGLAFDSEDNLYVVDGRKSILYIFRPDGTPLLEIGGEVTDHPMGFALPVGLWVDGKDRIYITDMMNLRFVMWQFLSAAYLKDHPIDPEQIEVLKQRVEELQQKGRGKQAGR